MPRALALLLLPALPAPGGARPDRFTYNAANPRPTYTTTTVPPTLTSTNTTTTSTTAKPTTTTPIAPLVALEGAVGDLDPGLVAEQYNFATGARIVAAIDATVAHWGKHYSKLAIRWTGLLRVETAGAYRFQLTVLGGGDLMLDGQTLLTAVSSAEQTETKEAVTNVTEPQQIAVGDHTLVVRYSEEEGLSGISFKYQGPDNHNLMSVVPANKLFHPRGPCSLRGLPHVFHTPCRGAEGNDPRWALGDGEECLPVCEAGYASYGAVRCLAGNLTPTDFACEARRCTAPLVANASNQSCQEGAQIHSGRSCTPSCRPGFAPQAGGFLNCLNGTMTGSFKCMVQRSCILAPIAHSSASGPCESGAGAVLHGAACVARCEPGYTPTRNLTCNNGQFEQYDSFECVREPNTTLTTRDGLMVTTTTSAKREIFLGAAQINLAEGTPMRLPGGIQLWALAFLALLALGMCGGLLLLARTSSSAQRRGKKRSATLDGLSSDSSDWEDETQSRKSYHNSEPASDDDGRESEYDAHRQAETPLLSAFEPRPDIELEQWRGKEDAKEQPNAEPREPERPRILASSWRPLGRADEPPPRRPAGGQESVFVPRLGHQRQDFEDDRVPHFRALQQQQKHQQQLQLQQQLEEEQLQQQRAPWSDVRFACEDDRAPSFGVQQHQQQHRQQHKVPWSDVRIN